MLLRVPTVTVMPEKEERVHCSSYRARTSKSGVKPRRAVTEQVVGRAQLLEVQEQEALDEAPEVAEREQEEDEAHDVGHLEQAQQVLHDVLGGHVAADGHEC